MSDNIKHGDCVYCIHRMKKMFDDPCNDCLHLLTDGKSDPWQEEEKETISLTAKYIDEGIPFEEKLDRLRSNK